MAENTMISWCNHTANLWWGCQKVHAGCDNCYAETLDNRYNHDAPHWGPHTPRKIVNSVWKDLEKFQRLAAAKNEVHTVFVGSMMDIAEKPMPLVDNKNNPIEGMTTHDLRTRFFTDYVPRMPNLIFLLLSKRPGNYKKYVPAGWLVNPPSNVMYGYSAVDENTTQGIDELVDMPGRRFLSMEPLLGDVNLSKWLWSPGWVPTYNDTDNSGGQPNFEPSGLLSWVIVGGESGHGARPMEIAWARSIRDQCIAADVPFHFKQWGNHEPDGNEVMQHVNVKDHNALLDGKEWKEFPKP